MYSRQELSGYFFSKCHFSHIRANCLNVRFFQMEIIWNNKMNNNMLDVFSEALFATCKSSVLLHLDAFRNNIVSAWPWRRTVTESGGLRSCSTITSVHSTLDKHAEPVLLHTWLYVMPPLHFMDINDTGMHIWYSAINHVPPHHQMFLQLHKKEQFVCRLCPFLISSILKEFSQ